MSKPAITRRYLDTDETEAYTGIPKSTWCNHRVAGTGIPFIKVGTRVYYDINDIDAYMESLKQPLSRDARPVDPKMSSVAQRTHAKARVENTRNIGNRKRSSVNSAAVAQQGVV